MEMIKNADLYDLINLSLRHSDLKNETVESFISRALDSRNASAVQQLTSSQEDLSTPEQKMIFTPPSKATVKKSISRSPS
jgi:hypothetical protein